MCIRDSYITDKLLICGDTLFCESYGRTDLPTGNNNDMVNSIKKLKQDVYKRQMYYIPSRETEGYGMNKGAIDILAEKGVKSVSYTHLIYGRTCF